MNCGWQSHGAMTVLEVYLYRFFEKWTKTCNMKQNIFCSWIKRSICTTFFRLLLLIFVYYMWWVIYIQLIIHVHCFFSIHVCIFQVRITISLKIPYTNKLVINSIKPFMKTISILYVQTYFQSTNLYLYWKFYLSIDL